MVKRNDWSNQTRFSGLAGMLSMGFAVLLSVASVGVVAQTAFEFEDPLDEMRAKIERTTPADANGSGAATQNTDGWAATAEPGQRAQKDQSARLADRFGLPTAGLIGLGILGLLAALLGAMWFIGRRQAARTIKRKDRALYAVASGSRARRTLDSGARVTRNRKQSLDTTENSDAAEPSAAAAAARILSHDDEVDESQLAAAYAAAPDSAADTEARQQPVDRPVDRKDPTTWKRPNLDRLKESIRGDWKGDADAPSAEAEQAAEQSPLRDDAKAFADLFGDDTSPDKTTRTAKSPVMDMLDTFEEDRDSIPVNALRDAVEKTTATRPTAPPATRPARPPQPSRSDAIRRIRALRDSVKAS